MSWHLPERLTGLSESKIWPRNVAEWKLHDVYNLRPGEDTEYCLCSHWIRQVCVVKNGQNGHEAKIGNCCIRFFEKHSASFEGMHTVQDGLRRIQEDKSRAANVGLVEQAFRSGVLNTWERDFCIDTAKKRSLTDAQVATKEKINKKLIQGISTTAQEAFDTIRADRKASPNPKLIDAALEKRVIRPQDAAFLRQTWNKPYSILSEKQQAYRRSLNDRMVQQLMIGIRL